MQDETGANFESPEQALKEGGATPASNEVKMWMAAIDAASKEEEKWRKEADESIRIYRAEDDAENQTFFNILHSNIETTLPAIYNSTPIPDIRRRFNDPGPVPKAVADILERAISYSLDSYDFDGTMRSTLFDGYVPGRGTARVRYKPYFDDNETEVTHEEVVCEYVHWKHYRRGPGFTWADVTWEAFELFLDRKALIELCGDKLGKAVKLDCMTLNADKGDDDEQSGAPKSEIFGRARVWEVWDKDTKQVLFIAPSYKDGPVKKLDDPLELADFFCTPRPLQPLLTPGNMVPMCPYRTYRKLSEELNDVTKRIRKLVAQLRVRGMYASSGQDFENILGADDGELVPVQGLEGLQDGIEKMIAWWPMDPTVKALAQLYQQREQVKQTIYEVTGLSDILRGNTEASETATAQQLKSQWGSLRIQRMQADVARFARDLFRIKAEIISTKFSMQTLIMMTGVELIPEAQKQQIQQQVQQQAQQAAQQAQMTGQPPQPPQEPPEDVKKALETPTVEDVEKILRSDLLRSYKIDIESDSTIRADLTREKGEVSEFIQGASAYIAAVGPAIMSGIIPGQLAIEIFASFARLFRLGKSAEDAIEQASSEARKAAQQPQQEKPDPEMVKAQAVAKAKQDEMALKKQQHDADMEMAREELKMEREKAELEGEIAVNKARLEVWIKQQDATLKRNMAMDSHQNEQIRADEMHRAGIDQIESGNMMAMESHGAEMDGMQAEGQRADEKHKVGLQVTKAKAKQKPASSK